MTEFATFEFYSGTFGGDVVPQTSWKRILLKATAKIKEITFGRADPADATNGELVKLATCAVADLLYRAEAGAGSLPVSEGVSGDYSASYMQESLESRCYKAASSWLSGTGLLYAGV